MKSLGWEGDFSGFEWFWALPLPTPLLQVLRHCCASPRTIEALVNSYEHVRVTEEWAEAVPSELLQVTVKWEQSGPSLYPVTPTRTQ